MTELDREIQTLRAAIKDLMKYHHHGCRYCLYRDRECRRGTDSCTPVIDLEGAPR